MQGLLVRIVPQSLAVRIGIAVVIAGLFPILVLFIGFLVANSLEKGVDEHFRIHSETASESVRQALEQRADLMREAAQDGFLRDPSTSDADVENRLRELNGFMPEFYHLTLLDLDGRTRASSNYQLQGDWRDHQAYQQDISGDVTISKAYTSLSTEKPTIYFAAPVLDQAGGVASVLLGEAPVKSFAGPVLRLRTSEEDDSESSAFVVDSQGMVIAHPGDDGLMEKIDLPVSHSLSEPDLDIVEENGREFVYAVAPVKVTGMLDDWRVVVRSPVDEAYAYRRPVSWLVYAGSIATAVVVLLVGSSLGAYISGPVRRVTAAARRIAAGDLRTRVEGSTGGELGELSNSFNSMADELQDRVHELQESRTRIVAVQEGVRREIASHLHGRVQGRLLAIKGRLQELLSGRAPSSEMPELVADVVENLDQVIQEEVSVLSRQLYPSILGLGLVPALRSLAGQFEGILTIDTELDEELVTRERADRNLVSGEVKLAAYRITEDALTNVVKHSRATKVILRVELYAEGELHLSVRDNGQGFDVESVTAGLGLAAIQDYAEAVGGQSVIQSTPGRGTEITAKFPVAGLDAEHPQKSAPWE